MIGSSNTGLAYGCFAETLLGAKLEAHRVGVNLVERTILYVDLQVVHRVTRQYTCAHSAFETFLNSRNEFFSG